MEGEQGARGDGEVLAASLAAQAERARRLPALIDDLAAAVRARRLGVLPAHPNERRFGFLVRRAEDRRQTERPGLGREEEVLRNGVEYDLIWSYMTLLMRPVDKEMLDTPLSGHG